MLKRTPFYEQHKEQNAKLIDFGGFEMPVQYAGIKQEHNAVRERVGLFDVSHMGEFFVSGPQALPLIQKVTINDASGLIPGKAQYTAMCYEDGGIVDDLLVYKLKDEQYMLVVNASNIDKDREWILSQNSMNATFQDKSDSMALLALQGPESVELLQKLTDVKVADIKFYNFAIGNVAGVSDVIISATGYTGEKGFELYINAETSNPSKIWSALFENKSDLEPAGLGARDTLRLEMGFALYGNDITKETNPLEARMGWLTKLNKDSFIGKDALMKQKQQGLSRKLVGFEIEEPRNVPRAGYKISDEDGQEIGFVTSGTQSISLKKGIGMGYISIDKATEGQTVFIQIRKKRVPAKIVRPPFLKK